ncbi:SDR family NAD(P)-dependent oxidoreductase, partial [Xanthomonas sp. SHU 199]
MSALASPQAGALAQRVVLVSGAAGGLGSAAALACAQAGATVVLLGHKPARLNRVYDAIAAVGAAPLLYPLDLLGATPPDYATLAERLQGELGRLDGLLHCAADFAGLTPFEHADPAQFARAIHVNLTAAAWLTQACLPLLRQAEDAAIVFAVDDPARVGQAYWGGYGAAQHGR